MTGLKKQQCVDHLISLYPAASDTGSLISKKILSANRGPIDIYLLALRIYSAQVPLEIDRNSLLNDSTFFDWSSRFDVVTEYHHALDISTSKLIFLSKLNCMCKAIMSACSTFDIDIDNCRKMLTTEACEKFIRSAPLNCSKSDNNSFERIKSGLQCIKHWSEIRLCDDHQEYLFPNLYINIAAKPYPMTNGDIGIICHYIHLIKGGIVQYLSALK